MARKNSEEAKAHTASSNLIGYARVSRAEQNLAMELAALCRLPKWESGISFWGVFIRAYSFCFLSASPTFSFSSGAARARSLRAQAAASRTS